MSQLKIASWQQWDINQAVPTTSYFYLWIALYLDTHYFNGTTQKQTTRFTYS